MTKLVWDQIGERRYEVRVDRGVLYLSDGSGVPWNGLTSVEEDTGDIAVEAFYFDGFKYLETRTSGDFSGSLKAFTFPEEFVKFDGLEAIKNGVELGNQPITNRFGISYRTRIGNDVDGFDYGYKIHLVYNLTASPDSRSYETLSDQQDPMEFSWKISAVPEFIPGHRPTAHVILDTTKLNRYLVADLETLLYGKESIVQSEQDILADGQSSPPINDFDGGTPTSSGTDVSDGGTPYEVSTTIVDGGFTNSLVVIVPTDVNSPGAHLPSLADLATLVENWILIEIIDNGDGTWTATGPDDIVNFIDLTTFQITSSSASFLNSETYTIKTTSTL